jgi:uncharacterized protein (DUF885 family)
MSLVEDCRKLAEARGQEPDTSRFQQLLDLAWQRTLQRSPEMATVLGVPGFDDRWSDSSPDAIAAQKEEAVALRRAVESIDRGALEEGRQLDFDLFRDAVDLEVEGSRFPAELLALSQMGGVHTSADILTATPRATVDGYENVLRRIQALPTVVDNTILLLTEGVEQGVVQPKVILRNVAGQIAAEVVDDPTASSFYGPFADFPASIGDSERARLRNEAGALITQHVVPALRRLHDFVAETYVPNCRTDTIGLGALPDGEAWYAHNVRLFTTTSMSPTEVHDLGLAEVDRLRSEMEALASEAGFSGDFEGFVHHLQTDAQFFFDAPEDLVTGYQALCKRIDAQLPTLFRTLPRLPYGVRAVPEYSHESGPAAYYMPGSFEGRRPGLFFANTFALDSKPKWEMEALALHEAMPGHHLQVALAAELTDLPEFRRFGRYTAYTEGWGLYAESLGGDLGLYQDAPSRFGQLAFEMWRAVRLVTDTGMHALGWTRQKAIDFFEERSGRAGHEVTTEVDRYLAIPGQALAYKVGELEIQSLRRTAESALRDRFDIRDFHDVVLGEGAVPLAVLRQQVERWIAAA